MKLLTKAQTAALRNMTSGPVAMSNVTSVDHATVYWQTIESLHAAELIEPAGRDDRLRPLYRITAAGREAVAS